jgi:hypothetical protein
MSTFSDLEDSILRTYNSQDLESLEDVSLDLEERDKIVSMVSSSNSSELNVDYSEFKNHIFFDSAYASVNFAASRIIESYPLDGELKDKTAWFDVNSGFENWFFENWPKQQGYVHLTSASNYLKVYDYEGVLNYNSGGRSGNFLVESVISPHPNLSANQIYPIVNFLGTGSADHGFSLFLQKEFSKKNLFLKFVNASGENIISASFDSNISSSCHVAAQVDQNNISLFVDGKIVKQTAILFSGTSNFSNNLTVGYFKSGSVEHFYSGSIDEVRVWCKDRSSDLISKNSARTIHANHSGGLKLYWKFNQSQEYGNKILDYSGNSLHGFITGSSPSVSSVLVTGTLGSWFKDSGDVIFNLQNSRVDSFLNTQRVSASNYDDSNANMIFNLVPGYFTEGDDTEYQQLFLLLTARHYDKFKLYIDHLSNVTRLTSDEFNGPPANLLDLAAQNYGIDIGGVFSNASPLQYFYGEEVNSTSGSIDSTIKSIRETLKRNVLANLSYIIKTKSTRQSIKAAISALGLDENVVSISEYTDFSGGIKTTYIPRTVETRVANFQTSSLIHVDSSAYNPISASTHQFRVLFNTASMHVSQSLFTAYRTDDFVFGARVERSNLTSSVAKFRLIAKNSVGGLIEATSSIEAFNNKWLNFSLMRDPTQNKISYRITSADRSGLLFSQSNSASLNLLTESATRITLGSSGSNYFSGAMHQYRAWNSFIPSDENIDRWGLDWENTEVDDIQRDIGKLVIHLKLNDFTASATGGGQIHNYVTALSGNSYSGFTTSSLSNFPGKFLDRFESSTSYDLSVDNDKIRIRDGSNFSSNDKNFDIPFISINFSPINSLNREIFKWIGDISKLSNILGETTNQYRDTNSKLNSIKSVFFKEKVSSKIDYDKFADIIKWFDDNFAHLLSQLVPLDIIPSISSYVIEPHLLELNTVKKSIASSNLNRNLNLQATISTSPSLTASSLSTELSLADPGRFGAFVSSSGEMSEDIYFTYATSSEGLNYSNVVGRRIVDISLRDDYEKNSPHGYGNGFYTSLITGSNYLKNTLNVNPNFNLSGIYYLGGGPKASYYLSSSQGQPLSDFTGSFAGYQDARWLWMQTTRSGSVSEIIDEEREQWVYDSGIGYGGLWGQLRFRSNKSTVGSPNYPSGSKEFGVRKSFIGESTSVGRVNFSDYITIFNSNELKTIMLWPLSNAFDGVELFFKNGTTDITFKDFSPAASFGQNFDIEGYNTLNIEILGRTNRIGGASNQTDLVFELKFQFFSKETPGVYGFENSMSSSIASGQFTTEMLETKYVMRINDLPKDSLSNFNLTMERSLPKQKFMRVFITPTATEAANLGSFFVSVKGILSNKESSADNISLRN